MPAPFQFLIESFIAKSFLHAGLGIVEVSVNTHHIVLAPLHSSVFPVRDCDSLDRNNDPGSWHIREACKTSKLFQVSPEVAVRITIAFGLIFFAAVVIR